MTNDIFLSCLHSGFKSKTQGMYFTPADYVIHIIGGVRKVARVVKRDPSTVSKWTRPPNLRGRGGKIPQSNWASILDHAARMKLDITIGDLHFGRRITR
jgi:hypothetical protein